MRISKYKLWFVSSTIALAILLSAGYGQCAVKKTSAKKPVVSKAAKITKVTVPSGPKLLSVVAGQPFETVPSSGSSKVLITLCPEETAPVTFTAHFGKALQGVNVSPACDLVGPGKIALNNLAVYKIDGEKLVCSSGSKLGASVDTDLGPNPTQFWVDVSVPKNTKPGLYKSAIKFTYNNKSLDYVSIYIKVLPLRLIGSSKQYTLCTPIAPNVNGVTDESYCRFLHTVSDIGFRAVSMDGTRDSVGTTMSACGTAGLIGATPVMLNNSVPTLEQVRALDNSRKAAGIRSSLYFCVDNPTGDDQVNTVLKQADALHWARVTVVDTVSDDQALSKMMSALDGVNYHIEMPYVQALINGGTNRTNKFEWYWWDARKSAWENRIYSGVALWRSGLYGCMPVWNPQDGEDSPYGLNSLSGEAFREGINDTRYITTYMKALRELKDKKREGDKDYIASTEAYLVGFMSKPLDQVKQSDLRVFRAKMAEFSIKLAAML